ncbi:MAG: oligoendopeptidase F [Erysipelotrichaceae bacterium]|nr:oligoendopeptidase F [Erysipelotrichaceae bacterium]
MNIVKERSEIENKYKWNLSSLYESDEAWEEDLKKVDEAAMKVAAYQGKLNSVETVLECLHASTDLSRLISNLFTYANLRKSEDTRAEDAQKMYMRVYMSYVKAVSSIAFMEPEFLSLPEETIELIVNDPSLEEFRFMLDNLKRRKPHTLSAREEQLLASFGEVLAAPGEIASNLQDADLIFEGVVDSEGKLHEMSSAAFGPLMMSSDRTLRKNAFLSMYKAYKQHINTFASSYSAQIKAAVAEAQARNYESSRAMSMAHENIPTEVYDNLIETVHQFMPAMHRYVSLRKRLLGVDELHYYDVYVPLVQTSEKNYSYEEAKQMVLDAVKPLGKEYCETVQKGFNDNWVDVYPNKGKSSGAYSSGTYDSNPFIMMNFTGSLDSVSTLAHEMGHSMHTWYSKKTQPVQYADYTLFVAEVASTVNENLMIEQLLAKTEDPEERLSLLNQYLENFKGTVYRQTMFAEFEKEAHAMAERGEALDPASLNRLYYNLVKSYFGPDMIMDEEAAYEWSRIPHFYRPFYVYKYSTGYSSAVALSEGILHEGEAAVQRYLEFLSMGGSKYPLDELKHAGVDLTTPAPVATALKKFEWVLDEAERMADLLGK